MFLLFGDGKWSKNHQRILKELIPDRYLVYDIDADFKELITEKIQGVFITCSTVNHYPILQHCFNLRVAVFCEKPICLKQEQLDELKKAMYCDQIFMSGHQLVFEPTFNNLRNPKYFNSMRAGAIPRTEGAILSLAVHDIAVAQHIFHTQQFEVLSVEGNEHECKIILESLPGNQICEIFVSSYSKIRLRNVSIVCDHNTVTLSPDNWGRIDLLKLEIECFLKCEMNNNVSPTNSFYQTEIVMNTIFKIIDKIKK